VSDLYPYLSGGWYASGQRGRTETEAGQRARLARGLMATADTQALSVADIQTKGIGFQQVWLAAASTTNRRAFFNAMRRRDPARTTALIAWANRQGIRGGIPTPAQREPERTAAPAPQTPGAGRVRLRVDPPTAEGEYRSCVQRPTIGRLLSPFGQRSSRQRPAEMVMHGGIDYGGAIGAPVVAAADGIVEHATANGARGFSRYGRVVVLKHPQFATGGQTVRTLYAHLNSHSVPVGTYVRAGQQIGELGNTNGTDRAPNTTFTGNAHLHFEVAQGRYPRPPVSRSAQDPRAYRIDPGLWLGSYTACTVVDAPEGEPVASVSSTQREGSRGDGFPLWGVFILAVLGLTFLGKTG